MFYFFERINFETQLTFLQNANINSENAQNLTFKNEIKYPLKSNEVCFFDYITILQNMKMLMQIADLRFCALTPYVPVLLCSYILMSGFLRVFYVEFSIKKKIFL